MSLNPEILMSERARKERAKDLLLPALAVFAYVLYWLNRHGFPLASKLEEAVGMAVLATAIFWFGAVQAAMSAMTAFLLGAVWILLIGEDGIGWVGLLTVVSLAAWRKETWDFPWKITLSALGSWFLTGLLAVDVAAVTGISVTDGGVRQLALIGGIAVWAAMTAASLPLLLTAAGIGAAYYWRVPGASALLAWAAMLIASAFWWVSHRQPAKKPQPPGALEHSGARFASTEEMEAYRYD